MADLQVNQLGTQKSSIDGTENIPMQQQAGGSGSTNRGLITLIRDWLFANPRKLYSGTSSPPQSTLTRGTLAEIRAALGSDSGLGAFNDETNAPFSVYAGQMVQFTGEDGGATQLGVTLSFGNGADPSRITVPFNGTVVAATGASSNLDGTITWSLNRNGAVPATTYDVSMTGASDDQTAVNDFSGTPLTVSAGDTLTYEISGAPTSHDGTTICFYVIFD